MEQLMLADQSVGAGFPPYVIAEIGANHNGDMGLARETIAAAQACGADAAKFQSWSPEGLVSQGEFARNAAAAGSKVSPKLMEMRQHQLSTQQHQELAKYCQGVGIAFLSSSFSASEVDLLDSLDVPAFKIASMDVNNPPLLAYTAKKGRPVVLSTGMATLGEIETALGILRENGSGPVALLHCVAIYPPDDNAVHLGNMATLRQAFDAPVGFSDHTLGPTLTLAAIALGACIVEKHFTLDKAMEGWDHAISADPDDLRIIVGEGRRVFSAIGSSVRTVSAVEMEKRKVFRRRLVVTRDVRSGETLSPDDVDSRRPGTGIGPDELRYVLGRPLTRDIGAEEELEWADLA